MTESHSHTATALTEGDILECLTRVARERLELKSEQLARLRLDTQLIDGLQLDSLMQVVLITAVEEHYGFVFDDEDRERLQAIQTMRDLVRLIQLRAAASRDTA